MVKLGISQNYTQYSILNHLDFHFPINDKDIIPPIYIWSNLYLVDSHQFWLIPSGTNVKINENCFWISTVSRVLDMDKPLLPIWLQNTNLKCKCQNIKFKYKFQILIPNTNSKYQFQMPIPNEKSKYQFQIPKTNVNSK